MIVQITQIAQEKTKTVKYRKIQIFTSRKDQGI